MFIPLIYQFHERNHFLDKYYFTFDFDITYNSMEDFNNIQGRNFNLIGKIYV